VVFSALLSSFVTALIVTVFKFLSLRARPYAEFGPFSFFNFHGLTQDARAFQSFPSGDVGVVAGAAAYLFFTTKNRFSGVLIFLLPLCTAFARMSANKHWPSDTLFAIGLGLIAAKFVRDYKKFKLQS
jgi:membrane-associated phospholipid phosphatase